MLIHLPFGWASLDYPIILAVNFCDHTRASIDPLFLVC
jgi:hypothetical protein